MLRAFIGTFFCFLCLFINVLVIAQTKPIGAPAKSGLLKGFVFDKKTGEPVLNANIIIADGKNGEQTNIDGYFSITLPPGNYNVIITSIGYDSLVTNINLLPDAVLSKTFKINPKEIELEGYEIKAHQTEKKTKINIGVTNITPTQMKLLPSAGGEPDLAQYLQVLPGVVFTGDQGGQLYIRGGSPVQTGIYLDGVTIYNPFHSIGLFSVFETEAIRSADVFSAGFNAMYGNRTSAIVDVHTKDGNKNETKGMISTSPLMTRGMLEGPIYKSKSENGAGISYLVTAKTSYLDQSSKSIYSFLGEPFSSGLPYSFTDLYGKVTFSGDNGSKLNLFAMNFDDHAILQNSSDHTPIADYHWHNTGGGATFVVTPGSSAALIDGKFAVSNYNIGLSTLNNPLDSMPRSSQIGSFEGAINFTFFLPNYSQIKYGAEVSGIHTTLTYYSSAGITTPLDQQSTTAALYFLWRKDYGGKFILEPTIRVQYYSELNKLSPEPRIGLKYNINDNLRLKAAAGVYSQSIIGTKSDLDIVNLFSGFLLSPEQTINDIHGNPVSTNLQVAYHGVAGIELDLKDIEFNLEPWYKNFGQVDELNRNKLYVSDPDFIAAEGVAYGLDFSGKYSVGRVYLWAAVGMQEVDYTSVGSNNQIQTYPTPFDTRLNTNIVASYTLGKKRDWELSCRFNMHAPFPFTQTQGFYEQLNMAQNGIGTNYLQTNGALGVLYADQINGGRLSYYHRLDASIKRKMMLGKRYELDATFAITNIYNRQNIFYVNRLTNAQIYQLPLFPSANLTFNF
jgi:CarboxypepD_reg-like domain/TonB-dependent Receptor Plug Domain